MFLLDRFSHISIAFYNLGFLSRYKIPPMGLQPVATLLLAWSAENEYISSRPVWYLKVLRFKFIKCKIQIRDPMNRESWIDFCGASLLES